MTEENEKPEDGMLKYHRENIEKATKKEAFYKEIVHSLQTEERFVNYFKGFTPESVETFIKTYANQKVNWYEHGDMFKRLAVSKGTRWNMIAERALYSIQSNKIQMLLDKWDANLYKPHELIFHDLLNMFNDPLNCKEITPISQEDLEIYLEWFDWHWEQAESVLYDESEDAENEWFEDYSDELKKVEDLKDIYGYSDYLKKVSSEKPIEETDEYITAKHENSRRRKEFEYSQLSREEEISRNTPPPPSTPIPIPTSNNTTTTPEIIPPPIVKKTPMTSEEIAEFMKVPALHTVSSYGDKELFEAFIKKFETPETLMYYKVMRRQQDKYDFLEQLDMTLIHLEEATAQIPINSNDDWRESVKNAYEMYARKTVRASIIYYWQAYCRNLETDKPFVYLNEDIRKHLIRPNEAEIRERSLNNILRGRELKGEPRDLNY